MSLTSKLIALIAGGFVIGYLAVAFVGLEIDFRNWTEGQRVGLFIAHMPLTAMLCFIVWMHHEEQGHKTQSKCKTAIGSKSYIYDPLTGNIYTPEN